MAKAGKVTFHLNKEEVAKLFPQYKGMVHDKAEEVAANVRRNVPDGVEVHVNDHTARDGRPVSTVVIAHPSGLARQAKDGVLTRSAAEAGLETTRYPET